MLAIQVLFFNLYVKSVAFPFIIQFFGTIINYTVDVQRFLKIDLHDLWMRFLNHFIGDFV